MAPSSRAVSAFGRALDALAILFVLGGASAYLVSYAGLEELRGLPAAEFTHGMEIDRLARFHRLDAISNWALAAVAAGIACGVLAWHLERRRRSTERARATGRTPPS